MAARRVERLGAGGQRCPLSRRRARRTLLVFCDSLSYYGPDRRAAVRRSADLAQYRCRPTRLGPRADRPDRLDVPRRVVGGHPGSAGVGGAAAGRRGDLRDRRDGFAAVAAADGAARADPLRAAAVAAALGARRIRLAAAAAVAGRPARAAAASDRRVPRDDQRRQSISTGPASRSWRRCRRCTSPRPTAGPTAGATARSTAITEWAERARRSASGPQGRRRRRGAERPGQSRRHPLELRGTPGGGRTDDQGPRRGGRDIRVAGD